jgi:hypothetical protein
MLLSSIAQARTQFAALDFLSHMELAQIHQLLAPYARKDDDPDGDWDDFGEPTEDFPPIPGRPPNSRTASIWVSGDSLFQCRNRLYLMANLNGASITSFKLSPAQLQHWPHIGGN